MSRGRQLLAPLRSRSFRSLWLSQVASELGDWAGRVALAILVFERTGSPVITGAVATASLAPFIGIGQVATSFASRFPRRRVLVFCDVARACAFFVMALNPPIVVLLGLAALAGVMTPPFEAVRSSVLPGTVEPDAYGDALALSTATMELALMVGYLSGGLIAASVGSRWALALNGGSFVLSAIFLLGLPRPRRTATQPEPVSVRAGFRAAFSDPLIRRFILSYAFVGACAITGEALAPAFVASELHGGAGMVGVLSAIVSGGAVVSTFFLPRKGGDEHLIRAGAWLAAGGALVSAFAFAFGSGLAGATVAYAALGVVFASRVLGNQVVGKRLPDPVRAAAFSVLLGVIALGQATGPLLAGLIAEHLGVRPALAGAAAAAAVVSALVAVAPQRAGAVTQPG